MGITIISLPLADVSKIIKIVSDPYQFFGKILIKYTKIRWKVVFIRLIPNIDCEVARVT